MAYSELWHRVMDPLQQTHWDLARVVVLLWHGGPGRLPVALRQGIGGDLALAGTPAQPVLD